MDIPMSSILHGNSVVVTSHEASTIVGRKQCCSEGRHRQNLRMIAVIGCTCLAGFTALFGVLIAFLFNRVNHLETVHNGIPSTETIPNMDAVYMNESSTTEPIHMWRRDAHTQEMEDTVTQFTTSSSLTDDASIVHVGGSKEIEYRAGEWISWMTDDSHLSIQHTPFVQDKFIIISQPGFYYVYTQLTYKNLPSRYETGFEIIRQANCGRGRSQQLLKSYVTQVTNQTSKDSVYIGGVFYLYTNDRIGVRMITNGNQLFNIIPGQAALCFFGTYIVTSDPSYDSRIADTCCCLSNV